ncbi:extracellular solute-binding protein [Kaustia mangrovi]|uniref:Extracellular solute-binding protein n=1 Tax=Kaustia mangrovi TaxID=2593653 RepID=A0A7S8HD82_9HYPH|nr:extracellular solute-binding protein [Kaustia mangrovi]QPC44355.1 extracellular solute-binding protein [Kaustia mangrovi]
MTQDPFSMTRRRFVAASALMGGSALAAGGLPGLARAMDPLRFAFWPWGSEIVEGNAKAFREEMGLPLELAPIPGDYAAVLETKLAGGAPLDMFYAQRGQASRWHAAGWIRPINDMPGLDEIKDQMFPGIVADARAMNGDYLGLTYYNGGPMCMFRNEEVLDKAGFGGTGNPDDYPKTWDEVADQARAIKKKGIVEHPMLINMYNAWTGLPWGLISQGFSEGETFVDADLKATFGPDTPLAKVLADWKQWWDEELVPHAVLSWSSTEASSSWMKGLHAFHTNMDYNSFNYNDPEKSRIAAYNCQNPVMPGTTNDTVLVGHALLAMSTRERSDAELEAAWELVKFYGYKNKAGEFAVHKKWVEKANLPVPFPAIYDDPEVKAAIMKWMYEPYAEESYGWLFAGRRRAMAPNMLKAPWYQEWDAAMHDMIADELLQSGSMTPKEVVVALRENWDRLYDKYM